MKRLIVLILMLTVTTVGCAKKQTEKSSLRNRSMRGYSGMVNGNSYIPMTNTQYTTNYKYQPTSGHYWGEITRGSFSQSQFDEAVGAFASTTLNTYDSPSELGYVSGDSGQSTGIRFWGNVLTTTAFRPTQMMNAQIQSSSEIRIVVWDSYAGQYDSSGQLISEYPVHIRGNASGVVSGNQAEITFQDAYGRITLHGQFDQNTFQGWVEFDNNQFWDGQRPGAAGYLGYFSVATCGFFRCQ